MLRSSLLDPFSAVEPRRKQVKDAKDLQHLINDLATRTDTSPPPYDFLELIGKGSFGRVYKWCVVYMSLLFQSVADKTQQKQVNA